VFSPAQLLYIEDVLGTTAAAYRRAPAAHESVEPALPTEVSTIVVLTPEIGDEARTLLGKILASIKLAEFTHVEGDRVVEAAHVLHFGDGAIQGRSTTMSGTCWGFHALERLIGETDEVRARKREVWTLLQQFAREVPCTKS
jgi:hypothetical protein